jgi:hypothetical protein
MTKTGVVHRKSSDRLGSGECRAQESGGLIGTLGSDRHGGAGVDIGTIESLDTGDAVGIGEGRVEEVEAAVDDTDSHILAGAGHREVCDREVNVVDPSQGTGVVAARSARVREGDTHNLGERRDRRETVDRNETDDMAADRADDLDALEAEGVREGEGGGVVGPDENHQGVGGRGGLVGRAQRQVSTEVGRQLGLSGRRGGEWEGKEMEEEGEEEEYRTKRVVHHV